MIKREYSSREPEILYDLFLMITSKMMRDWKVSELESVRMHFSSKLESVRIGKCQNWKVSELESVRIGKCQNRKVSELESVRIGKCQNRKVSELESVRIGKCQNRKVSESESVRILTLSNFFQNGQKMDSDTFRSPKMILSKLQKYMLCYHWIHSSKMHPDKYFRPLTSRLTVVKLLVANK